MNCTKLPNHQRATVSGEKDVDRLYTTTLRDGRRIGLVFNGIGFTTNTGRGFEDVLIWYARDHKVSWKDDAQFGTRCVVEGTMMVAHGRITDARTQDLSLPGLKRGDVGTIVLRQGDVEYEVEFTSLKREM